MTTYSCRVEPDDTIEAGPLVDSRDDGPSCPVVVDLMLEQQDFALFLTSRDARALAADLIAGAEYVEALL